MFSAFKDNRRIIQKALFDTGFWEIIQEDNTIILEEKKESAKLKQVKIEHIPVSSSRVENAYLINLELEIPILGNSPKTKTTEKALLLISEATCYIFMFELKSSLQADDDNDISAIRKKFSDTIGRISLLLTSFIFGENFKDAEVFYKGIVFYNQDHNLISEATDTLRRKDIFKPFLTPNMQNTNKKTTVGVVNDISGKHQLEVVFCKNPTINNDETSFSVDFNDFLEEWEYNLFLDAEVNLPQVKG